MYIYTNINIYIYIYTYTYINIYIYIFVYIPRVCMQQRTYMYIRPPRSFFLRMYFHTLCFVSVFPGAPTGASLVGRPVRQCRSLRPRSQAHRTNGYKRSRHVWRLTAIWESSTTNLRLKSKSIKNA